MQKQNKKFKMNILYRTKTLFVKFSFIVNLLRKIKVRNRLIISFMVISIIPLTLLGVFSYTLSSEVIENKTRSYSMQIINQAEKNIYNQLDNFSKYTFEVSNSKEVLANLRNINSQDTYKKFTASVYLNDMLIEKFSSVDKMNFAAIVSDPENSINFNMKDPKIIKKLITVAEKANGSSAWTFIENNKNYELICVRMIRELSSGKKIGYIFLGLKNDAVLNLYKNIDIGKNSEIFISKLDGTIISSSNSK